MAPSTPVQDVSIPNEAVFMSLHDHFPELGDLMSPSAFSEPFTISPIKDHPDRTSGSPRLTARDNVIMKRFTRPDSQGNPTNGSLVDSQPAQSLRQPPRASPGHSDSESRRHSTGSSGYLHTTDLSSAVTMNQTCRPAVIEGDRAESATTSDQPVEPRSTAQVQDIAASESPRLNNRIQLKECQHDGTQSGVAQDLESHAHNEDEEDSEVEAPIHDTVSEHSSDQSRQREQDTGSVLENIVSTKEVLLGFHLNTSKEAASPRGASPGSQEFDMAPLNHKFSFKVQKPLKRRTISRSRSVTSDPPSPPLPPAAHSHVYTPSERDLIMMLMQRTKQRDEQVSQALKDCKAVRAQEAGARKENCDLHERLDAISTQLVESEKRNVIVNDKLAVFTSKYQKIKNWALEMNKEYAILREQGEDVKTAFSDVTREKAELVESVSSLIEMQQKSQDVLAKIKSTTTESRSTLVGMNQQLEHKSSELEACRLELLRERCERKKLEVHVCYLTDNQAAFDRRSALRDRNLTEVLCTLTDRVTSVDCLAKDKVLEEEILQAIHEIAEKPSISRDDFIGLSESFKSFFEELSHIKPSLSTSMQQLGDQTSFHVNTACSHAIDAAVSKLKPGIDKLSDLEKVQVRLEERVQGRDVLCQAFEAGKQAAEAREVELQKLNSRIFCDFTRANQEHSTMEGKVIQGLEAKVSEVSVRWVVASKALEKAEGRLMSSENRVGTLLEELEEVKVQNASRRDQAQTEARSRMQHEISLLHEANIAKEKEMMAEHENAARSWNTSMVRIDSDLTVERHQHTKTKEQLQRHVVDQARLESKMSTAEEEVSMSIDKVDKLRTELNDVKQELERTRSGLDALSALEVKFQAKDLESQSLKSQSTELEKVRKELFDLRAQWDTNQEQQDLDKANYARVHEQLGTAKLDCDDVREQRDMLQADCKRLNHDINCLRTKLETAEAESSVVKDLEIDLAASRKLSTELKDKLEIAQGMIPEIDRLQRCIERKDDEVKETMRVLKITQDEAKQISVLLDERTELEKRISETTKTLENAQESLKRVVPLEESIILKDETIAELQRKAYENLEITLRLDEEREESHRKDMELASLQSQIAKMEKESQQIDQIIEQLPNDVMDAFLNLTQDTTLSLKTQVLPDSQTQSVANDRENESKTTSATERESVQPKRRVADRSGGIDPRLTILQPSGHTQAPHIANQACSEHIIVPDSQNEIDRAQNDGEPDSLTDEIPHLSSSSSDLTDLNDIHDTFADADEEDLYNIPQSPLPDTRSDELPNLRRAHSIASQESMLLQATPGGRTRREDVSVSKAQAPLPSHFAITGIQQTALAKPSPRRLRNESQGRGSTPFPDSIPNTTSARPQPNSAVKRRSDPPLEIDSGTKRLKRTPANLQLRPTRGQTPLVTDLPQSGTTSTPSGLPSTIRSANSGVSNTAPPARSQRKPRQGGRKTSKNERYDAQFSSAVITD